MRRASLSERPCQSGAVTILSLAPCVESLISHAKRQFVKRHLVGGCTVCILPSAKTDQGFLQLLGGVFAHVISPGLLDRTALSMGINVVQKNAGRNYYFVTLKNIFLIAMDDTVCLICGSTSHTSSSCPSEAARELAKPRAHRARRRICAASRVWKMFETAAGLTTKQAAGTGRGRSRNQPRQHP